MGGGHMEGKTHLVNWEVVCTDKARGGLGIRKLALLNKALLGKWIWRFASDKDNLWKQVIKMKYGQEDFGWKTKKARGAVGVGVWKEIWKESEWCWNNMSLKVGKGNTIRFWTDVWCSEIALSHCFPHLFAMAVQRNSTVEEMWDQNSGRGNWNLNFLRDFNDWEMGLVGDFLQVLRGHKPSGVEDSVLWSKERRAHFRVHRDDFLPNVKLQLFALIAKQQAFHQLRSVEQLGYITELMLRNDSGIHGVQFMIQSTVKGPGHIDSRIEEFLKMFEFKLYAMSEDEFKSNVNTLVDMKLEKYKNLWEESGFYWQEIYDGPSSLIGQKLRPFYLTLPNGDEQVAALKKLTQKELIDFFNEHIKVGAPQKKTLSVRVYGCLHTSEYAEEQKEANQPIQVKIDDIFKFRKSQPLYGSFKGGLGHVKL
ncbi:Insulin-degrading enzyme-like 1, peroxisomal [Vitis vinifera]|uniref:Insulin-degrading enzyme-like 1, peroxisomal n=1 Tax=Vitis vinifera TaxID=29760 RepID=A0A438JL26_VITVI|nr:Insulin-degrading enzyme-like 1, peroxisomal [Vitis vinifera]